MHTTLEKRFPKETIEQGEAATRLCSLKSSPALSCTKLMALGTPKIVPLILGNHHLDLGIRVGGLRFEGARSGASGLRIGI